VCVPGSAFGMEGAPANLLCHRRRRDRRRPEIGSSPLWIECRGRGIAECRRTNTNATNAVIRFEVFQSMTEPPRKRCPKCKGKVRRLVSGGAGIVFKGSGFYATDYRSKSYKDQKRKESGEPAKPKSESRIPGRRRIPARKRRATRAPNAFSLTHFSLFVSLPTVVRRVPSSPKSVLGSLDRKAAFDLTAIVYRYKLN